jgi:hypothetical protein
MASVASQLIEEVTAHAQRDSLEDAREICADGTYFPNNLRIILQSIFWSHKCYLQLKLCTQFPCSICYVPLILPYLFTLPKSDAGKNYKTRYATSSTVNFVHLQSYDSAYP